MKTLIIISLICSVLLLFNNLRLAKRYYKEYVNSLYEYNMGRGYFHSWNNALNNCRTRLVWSLVFLTTTIILYYDI